MKAIIVGATSHIAQALLEQMAEAYPDIEIHCVSRSTPAVQDIPEWQRWWPCDYTETAISLTCQAVMEQLEGALDFLIICNGILQTKDSPVEKRIEDFSAAGFEDLLRVNALIPITFIKGLFSVLKTQSKCRVVVFSARVGSIGDNRSGGWYSYRASKACLNMLLKNFAIECQRRAKGVSVLLFHPGTTDTPLSRPFHKSVPEGKLFKPSFVASQLISILNREDYASVVEFLDWQGQSIDW